jgi:hypothetical protein
MSGIDCPHPARENLMSDQQIQHFDRAADHFRQAILVVQDVIYGMMGVAGALLVAVNCFELNAHAREAGTLFAAGALLIAVSLIRWAFRRSPRQSS